MATKKYQSGGAKKYQLGGIAKAGKKVMRKAAKKVTKMMEGRTGTKAPTKSKVKKMVKKGTLGKGLKMQKGGSMTKAVKKVLGAPKKIKPFVGKRTISEKAAKRKVAKGKGTISYRVGGKDPGPGVYNKLSKKKKQFGNTGFSTRSIKGKGRTIRKKG
tara:strand:+ start:14 stop:487 length:474 start_codon:yes stop_codon:yes gene_type:complete